jgi:hypothetical protein
MSEVTVLVESSEVMYALKHCFDQAAKGASPEEDTSMPQWKMMMMTMMKDKRIGVLARTLDEDGDMDFVKMRMAAIWETMERGAEGTSNPSIFLA